MRTIHPHAQLGRLATLDTGAGASGQNEAEEETDEIYEAKKGEKNETDENSEVDEETDESQNEGKQVKVDPQKHSNLTKRKNRRVVQHSRKKNKEERNKKMDSTVIQWMSRG